jgi:cytoskeletal protein RodZ
MSIIESANGVGARLTQARSEQGLSVEDLSSRTYIRPGVIRGIENGDYAPCGGPFYARGHIRTLARTLGVDEGPLLQEFDRQHGAPEPRIAPETRTAEPVNLRAAKPRSPGANWMAVATGVLIVICLVALVGLLVGGPSKKSNNDSSSASQPAAPKTAAPKAAAPAPAPRTYNGVNLQVRLATGASWLRVVDGNGRILAAQVMPQGQTSNFQGAQQLRFTLGNAGAVQASCNGRSLGPLGGEGQVVTRTLVLNDPACGASTG